MGSKEANFDKLFLHRFWSTSLKLSNSPKIAKNGSRSEKLQFFLSNFLWNRKWKWHFRLFRWTKPNFSFSHIPHLCWWILVGMLSTTVSMNKARFQFQSHTSRVLMNIGGNFINDCFDEQNLISVSVAYLTYAEEIFILHSCHYLSSVIALLCWKLVLRMIVLDQLPLFTDSAKWKFLKGVTWGCTCLEKRDQRKPTQILGQSTFIHYLHDFW